MYPYHHGRHLFNQLKANTQAIWRGEELQEVSQKDKLYGHCIMYFETMTESLMQLCLNSAIIREFGLSPNGYERSNQISGLVSSLLSVIILFAKVRTKKSLFLFLQGFLCSKEINYMHTLEILIIQVGRCGVFRMISLLRGKGTIQFCHQLSLHVPNYTIFHDFRCKFRIALVEIVIQSHLGKKIA